jgi:hypothetical protein
MAPLGSATGLQEQSRAVCFGQEGVTNAAESDGNLIRAGRRTGNRNPTRNRGGGAGHLQSAAWGTCSVPL